MTDGRTTKWRRQSLFDGPAVPVQAQPQRAPRQAIGACPFGNRHGSAVERDTGVSTRVVALRHRECPSTQAWAVGAVVVDSVQRRALRARSHVTVKGREIASPRLEHCDASPTVIGMLGILRVEASALGVLPRPMLPGAAPAVRGVCSEQRLAGPTPATLRVPGSQLLRRHLDHGSAGTAAFPECVVIAAPDSLYHREAME